MLILSSDNFIGEGVFRVCYSHPDNANQCVKVFKRDTSESPTDFTELSRELKYYELLEKRNICWDHLSRYHGVVSTSVGDGYVFDMIRDADGQVSKTLEYYLNKSNIAGVEDALIQLADYLSTNAIVTRVMRPRNIVLRTETDGSYKAFVIDDVLNDEFIPISSYVTFFARKKIKRRFDRFEKSLSKYGLFVK